MAKATQRTSAAALMIAFLLPLLACVVALSFSPEASLPACCRSHGKHHCIMPPEQRAALLHGNHFTEVHSKCPLFPRGIMLPGTHNLSWHAATKLSAANISLGVLQPQIEMSKRFLLGGAHYDRGPPNVSPS